MVKKTFTVADSALESCLGEWTFENARTASDGAWDFESIFVDSQTFDFRVERAHWHS
jgi:hypothetical protein